MLKQPQLPSRTVPLVLLQCIGSPVSIQIHQNMHFAVTCTQVLLHERWQQSWGEAQRVCWWLLHRRWACTYTATQQAFRG